MEPRRDGRGVMTPSLIGEKVHIVDSLGFRKKEKGEKERPPLDSI